MKALLVFAVGLAFGQQNSAPTFRSESNLVPIEVQVVEGQSRRPVGELTRDDFLVFDEGNQTEIVAFDDGSGPRDVALLLDVSGGFANEGVYFSALALLELQREQDRVALLSFSDGRAELRTPLTRAADEIKRGLDQIFSVDRNNNRRSVKNSRLLDAIRSAAEALVETEAPRRPLIVVVTHNREKSSTARQQDLIADLLTRSIRVEAITIPEEWASSGPRIGGFFGNPHLGLPSTSTNRTPPPPEYLEDLHSVEPIAAATGGQVVHLDYLNARRVPAGQPNGRTWDVGTVAAIIDRELLSRIREEYGLAIRGASSAKPQFHRLEVKLSPEAQKQYPNAVIYSRSGYYSAPSSDSKTAGKPGK